MMRSKTYILTSAVALLLCLATLFSVGGAIPAEAAGVPNMNFGVPSAENNTTLLPSALLEKLYPTLELSAAEQAYIDENLVSFTFNSALPQEAVRTLYHKDTGVLDITAPAYTYTAQNGTKVEWIPRDITISGRTLSFSKNENDEYLCAFDGLHYAEDFDMKVSFEWEATLSEEMTEYLLMQSRTDGKTIADALKNYDEQMKAYREQVAAHQAYVKYQADKAAFDRYQEAMAEYTAKKAEYDAYVAAKAKYDAELKAYQDYLKAAEEHRVAWEKYREYSNFMEQYGQAYANYLVYRQQVERAMAKLRVMELLFVKDSHRWNIYDDIMGDTVSIVLENQDLLIKIGYTRADDAGEATRALRTLLKGYSDVRSAKYASAHDRSKAMYEYYCKNYEAIKKNFIQLYEALYNLYSNGIVIDYVESNDRGPHFRQFIGVLYIVSYCLDDTKAMSMDWTPGKKFKDTLSKWVEPVQILVDNVQATPGSDIFPATEIAEIIPVEPAPLPGEAPKRVNPPESADPKPVPEPVMPPEVKDPGQAPANVPMPESEPKAPEMTEIQRRWASEYSKVDYRAREALCKESKTTFAVTLSRRVSIDNSFKITFYLHDGKTVYREMTLKYGDSSDLIDYSTHPKRETTAQYSYDFVAWTLFNGEVWEGETVVSDLSFIPRYRSLLRSYRVDWVIDGELKYSTFIPYGTTPSYPYLLEKPANEEFTYTFAGWNEEILPVTGDVTYTGSFTPTRRSYTVTWICGPKTYTEVYEAGSMPAFKQVANYASRTHYFTFARWNMPLVPVLRDVTYVAEYTTSPFSMDAYGALTEVTETEEWVSVQLRGSTVAFGKVAAYAQELNKDLVLQCGAAGLHIGAESAALLQSLGCAKIAFEEKEGLLGNSYVVRFYNSYGQPIDADVSFELLYYYTAGNGGIPVCYVKNGEEWQSLESTRGGGVMRAEYMGAGEFLMRIEYYLNYASNPNCDTLSLLQMAPVGSKVDFFNAACTYGYEITAVVARDANGNEIAVDALSFIMPEGSVEITLNIERIVYNVSFVVNGSVILQKEYFLGELIEAPTDPTMDAADGYIYSFTGWSPSVTLAIGEERDMIFEAQFLKSIAGGEQDQDELSDNSIGKRLILIGVLGILSIAAIVLAIIFRRRIAKGVRFVAKKLKTCVLKRK